MFYPQVVTSSEIKGYVQGAEGPNHYPLCGPLYAFILDAWSSRTKLKWNKTYSHKLPEAWKGILLTFWISYVSWVLANIMTGSSHWLWKWDWNSGCRLCLMVCLDCVQIMIILMDTKVKSWWRQWTVMTTYHSYSWWRWWSETLWATLMKLWLHLSSCYQMWFFCCGDFSALSLLWSETETEELLHLTICQS
jgi:hypothetical protein